MYAIHNLRFVPPHFFQMAAGEKASDCWGLRWDVSDAQNGGDKPSRVTRKQIPKFFPKPAPFRIAEKQSTQFAASPAKTGVNFAGRKMKLGGDFGQLETTVKVKEKNLPLFAR
jgi:hypothetical protein